MSRAVDKLTVYLKADKYGLCIPMVIGLVRPEANVLIGLPESLVSADDTDFVSFEN